ncbi:MAG TPA: FAD-dependent oxidoreductase [Longimicrobium sp.]|nr:FAD-dependent oxidoreductase [Longimicrobium sp.]
MGVVPADVLVAGGGPGGCACALALRAHAPGLSIVLAEASDYEAPRIGETLSPVAGRVLRHLGVWDAFAAQAHAPGYSTAAAWGAALPHEHEFIFSARGVGWHLDRAAFDAMLAREAELRGVRVMRGARVESVVRREGGGWTASLSPGGAVTARVVVDATGARAGLARRLGARTAAVDRLAGFVRFFRGRGGGEARTLVEAFADGWWYTAPLPGGGRVVACMTDTDLGRELGLAGVDAWERMLGAAPLVRAEVGGAEPEGPVTVRAARSRSLRPAAGDDWLAVGDAACTFDPLSSQGVLKALRSGVFAAYAAGDLLAAGDPAGMERYRRFVADEFAGYLRIRAAYYAEERRWPEREFWRRRHAALLAQAAA